jgi:uncharacterized RDD family membrane protein YckC
MDVDGAEPRTVFVIGFGRRLAAAVIDGLIIGILSWLLATVIGAIAVFSGGFDIGIVKLAADSEPAPINVLVFLSVILVSLIYYVRSWARSGQTLGKMLLGIKVVLASGSPLSLGPAFLRYIGYVISGAVLSLGFVWIEFDRIRQGWHDKIARTIVVWEEEGFSDTDAIKLVPEDPDRGKLLFAVWVIVLIVMPGALLAGLWVLGPAINRSLTDFLTSLK